MLMMMMMMMVMMVMMMMMIMMHKATANRLGMQAWHAQQLKPTDLQSTKQLGENNNRTACMQGKPKGDQHGVGGGKRNPDCNQGT